MKKLLAIGMSPNTQISDVLAAGKLILMPWKYKYGPAVSALEDWFRAYLKISYAETFSSARACLFVILEAMGVGSGDEVILQSFTCVVVPNAISALGAVPVYADVTKSLTLDPSDVKKKISSRTKAIIVQHTFGIPANMDTLTQLAKEHNIPVIEDVAHTIGGEYNGKKLGTLGDAAIFSFGRDKAFSSVFGGVAVTKHKILGEKIRKVKHAAHSESTSWIVQQLLHPIAFSLILPLYSFFSVGKILLVLLQKIHLLSFPLERNEKKGIFEKKRVRKYPNALAELALIQLQKLDAYNRTRKKIAAKYAAYCTAEHIASVPYSGETVLLRFPIFVKNQSEVIMKARQKHLYLGNWYSNVIDPKGTDLSAVSYVPRSTPMAEELAGNIVNLPLLPGMTEEDTDTIISVLKKYSQT